VPILAISRPFAHASVTITLNAYGHLMEGAGVQAADALEALVYGTGA
jgi:hypothetical protein